MDILMLFHDDPQPISTPKPTRNKVVASERQGQLLVEAEESGRIVYPFIVNPVSSTSESKPEQPKFKKDNSAKDEKMITSSVRQGEHRVILQLLDK